MAPTVLDRRLGIETRWAIDVDVIGVEALERIAERGLERVRAGVEADELAAGRALRAELDAEQIFVARHAAQRTAEQHLVMAHGVEVTDIEQRHAGIERGVDDRLALSFIGGAVDFRHAHAAEAEGGNLRTGLSEAARQQIVGTLERFELPTRLPTSFPKDGILNAVRLDKKFAKGEVRFVVVPAIGGALIVFGRRKA